ncbi:hypothetical protein E2320_003715, partial [Naja naja]
MNLGADIPPPPVLKLDPLSQRVKEGDCLFLLCLAEGSSTEKKFHFYKDGVEITSSQECLPKNSSKPVDLLQSGSLRILCNNSTHNGEFACSYEEKRSNRWIILHQRFRSCGEICLDSDSFDNPAGLEAKEPNEEKEEHGKRHHQAAAAAAAPASVDLLQSIFTWASHGGPLPTTGRRDVYIQTTGLLFAEPQKEPTC